MPPDIHRRTHKEQPASSSRCNTRPDKAHLSHDSLSMQGDCFSSAIRQVSSRAARLRADLQQYGNMLQGLAPVQVPEQGPQAPALHTCSAHVAILQAASTGAGGGSAEQPGSPGTGASPCGGTGPGEAAEHRAVRVAVPPPQGALQVCQALKRHCAPVHAKALPPCGAPLCLLTAALHLTDHLMQPIQVLHTRAGHVTPSNIDRGRRRRRKGGRNGRAATQARVPALGYLG